MVDSATSRFGARKQSLGSNVNTWGDTKLNEVLDLFDRGGKGYESITMTGDTTLTWTNYATTNQGQVDALQLAGSLSSAASLVIPSRQWTFKVYNVTGVTVTVKTAAGTGVAIPTGYICDLYCDATDVYARGTFFNGVVRASTAVAGGDVPNLTQVSALIAAASISGTGNTAKVSAADTTSKYIFSMFTTNITGALTLQLAILNAGGNEQIRITGSVGALGLTDGGEQTSGFTAAVNTRYRARWSTAQTITLPASPTAGDVVQIAYATTAPTTLGRNGNNINNQANNFVREPGYFTETYTYNATAGWC